MRASQLLLALCLLAGVFSLILASGAAEGTGSVQRRAVATVTVLDEQPGHTTLNEVDASSFISTTRITVATDDLGSAVTISPSTDGDGTVHLATIHPSQDVSVSTIGYLSADHSLIETTDEHGSTIYVTRTGKWAKETSTSKVPAEIIRSGTVSEIRPVVEPVSTVTKYITTTLTSVISSGNCHHRSGTAVVIAKTPYPCLVSSGPYRSTQTMINIDGQEVSMTSPTQTGNDHIVYVADPLIKYRVYDPQTNPAAPTEACSGLGGSHWLRDVFNIRQDHAKTDCSIEMCMWSHLRPISVKTAAPMLMEDGYGRWISDYFTHTTEIVQAHWGTTETCGIYFPTGRPDVRATPRTFNPERGNYIDGWVYMGELFYGNTNCSCAESCHRDCLAKAADPDFFDTPWHYLAVLGPVLFLLLVLPCCCCAFFCCSSKRRDQLRQRYIKNQKPAEKAGQPIDANEAPPLAGPIAGAAAIAAANDTSTNAPAGTSETDNGRGTTGRKAEEGRGRVNFADGGQPGTDARPGSAAGGEGATGAAKPAENGATTAKPAEGGTTAAQPAEGGASTAQPAESGAATAKPAEGAQTAATPAGQPATTATATTAAAPEHTEPVPVHDGATDGAADTASGTGTGRHMPDMNSMRGRKRNRPEGGNGVGGLLGVF